MARIVIIEDEPGFRRVLEYNMKQAGHDVRATGEGAMGIAEEQGWKPDVVLLDVMLPDIQGTDACRSLKQDPATRAVPVIMVTAKGEELDRVVGFELGADVLRPSSDTAPQQIQ
jgi:two-component system phosphate regulon response regulator PhoB